MQPCDLVVRAAHLLPVAPQNVVLENHAFAVSEGVIRGIAPAAEIDANFAPEEVLDFDHHIVMPGLVNAHGHAAMTLLRGAGEDQPLQEWLTQTIWPLEARHVDADAVALGTELAIGEMLLSGTTTFSDMYFFPEVVGHTADTLGMRCQVAFPVIKFPNVYSKSAQDGIHKGLELHDRFKHNALVNVAFGPHAAYTVDFPDLEKVAMYSNELGAGVQIHLHENAAEVDDAIATHGRDWLQVMQEIGLLGPQLQAVHMTQLSATDIELVAATGAQVVHCPASNMKLASGYCPINQLQAAGVNVGLGTDGAASNNTLDMFGELHLAALLEKHQTGDAACGRASDMLRMGTLGSAQALGLEGSIGSLEPGKFADFIALDCNSLNTLPLHDPFAAAAHGNASRAVSDVYVAGGALVRGRELTRIDSTDLAARVRGWHARTHAESRSQ